MDVSTHVDLVEVKFSPDGRRIAAYEEKAGILYVWEIQESTLRLIGCTPKSLDC